MEQIAAVLILVGAIYAVARAIGHTVLAPIHAKLDRLLAMNEALARPQNPASATPSPDRSVLAGDTGTPPSAS